MSPEQRRHGAGHGPGKARQLQSFVAAFTAVGFFGLAALISYENYEHVLTARAKVAQHASELEVQKNAAKVAATQKLAELDADWKMERERIAREHADEIAAVEKARDLIVSRIQSELSEKRAEAETACAAEIAERERADDRKTESKKTEGLQFLAPFKQERTKVEGEWAKAHLEKDKAEEERRASEQQAEQFKDSKLADQKREVERWEWWAEKAGWQRGPNGRIIAPERSRFSPVKIVDGAIAWSEKLSKAYDDLDAGHTRWRELEGKVRQAAESFHKLGVVLHTWSDRKQEVIRQLELEESKIAQEFRLYGDKVNDETRLARLQATARLLAKLNDLTASAFNKTEKENGDGKVKTLAVRARETQALQQAQQGTDEARAKFQTEIDRRLKELGGELPSHLKRWQLDDRMRWWVGLLHFFTAAYALVLSGRCTVRWLQLNGWCSEPFIVAPK